jgi:hypothetical protein
MGRRREIRLVLALPPAVEGAPILPERGTNVNRNIGNLRPEQLRMPNLVAGMQ